MMIDVDDQALVDLREKIDDLGVLGLMSSAAYFEQLPAEWKNQHKIRKSDAAHVMIGEFRSIAWQIKLLAHQAGLLEKVDNGEN